MAYQNINIFHYFIVKYSIMESIPSKKEEEKAVPLTKEEDPTLEFKDPALASFA